MKFKMWLVRVGVGLIVAVVAPILLSAGLSLVPGAVDVTLAQWINSSTEANVVLAYTVVSLVTLLLVVLYQLMVQPLVSRFEEDDREEGLVKWFNVSKGFGFVTRESGEDVFVHFRSIRGRGHRSLQEGQRVRFGVVESSKGLQAEDVTIVRQR